MKVEYVDCGTTAVEDLRPGEAFFLPASAEVWIRALILDRKVENAIERTYETKQVCVVSLGSGTMTFVGHDTLVNPVKSTLTVEGAKDV